MKMTLEKHGQKIRRLALLHHSVIDSIEKRPEHEGSEDTEDIPLVEPVYGHITGWVQKDCTANH
jgi:hypothetical protein